MTSPPPDDIVQGAVKFLLQQPSLTSLVGSTPDEQTGIAVPWIFQDQSFFTIEGTQKSMVVVSYDGPSATPNNYNTAEFLRLRVDVWSDPPRDANNNPTNVATPRLMVKQIGRVIDTFFHRVGGDAVLWGTVATITSVKMNDMAIFPDPEHMMVIKGSTFYSVEAIYTA